MAEKMKTRALNEKFLNEFLTGKLNNLLEIIKSDDSLIMCLRGDYTTVYYRGLQILKIKQNLSFSVDKNYKIEIQPSLDCDWIEYFKEAKQKIDTHCLKSTKLEKEIQQIIFRENSCNCIADETDYFIVDLEYNHSFSKERKARFDALAIFWPRNNRAIGNKTKLAIIEIKAGLKALNGKCGLVDHHHDVIEFLENINKNEFLNDMKNVFVQMKKLGMINTKANPEKITLDKNVQFIFALANYNDNSILLRQAINEMPIDENTLFATSPCLGYGLYEKHMLDSKKMLEKIAKE